jgi:RimJ/RimL family protein N-acetyltransferase
MALRLRPAEAGDLYCLWLWANDPETRRASFGRSTVSWSEHVAWFERQRSDRAYVFIGETAETQPIGSVRFDTTDGWRTARLSYVVAPEARRRGWSLPLVTEGIGLLGAQRPGVVIAARVMADNVGSLRLFRGLGWSESVEGGDHQFVQMPDARLI